jgi:hypothetical protein
MLRQLFAKRVNLNGPLVLMNLLAFFGQCGAQLSSANSGFGGAQLRAHMRRQLATVLRMLAGHLTPYLENPSGPADCSVTGSQRAPQGATGDLGPAIQ